jgi:hypothetical protein
MTLSWLGEPPPRAAADSEFIPEVEFRVGVAGNPAIVGEESESSAAARFTVGLTYERRSPATDLSLTYRPYREIYDEAEEIDYTGHVVRFDVDHEISRRSDFSFKLNGARSEQQSVVRALPDQPLSLVPRTQITRIQASANWGLKTGRKGLVDLGLGGWLQDFDQDEFESSDTLFASAGYNHQVARATSLGFNYSYQSISYDAGSTTDVHTGRVNVEHQFGRYTTGTLAVGAFTARATDSVSDPSVELSVTRQVGERSDLTAGVRQAASAGTGLTSSSRDRGAWLGWAWRSARLLTAQVNVSLWRRDDLDLGEGALSAGAETLVTRESLGWNIGRYLDVGISHSYSDQNALDDNPILDTSYHSGSVFLRWTILGR